MPYYSLTVPPQLDPDIDLRLEGPTTFVLLHGFRYVDPDDGDKEWVVNDDLRTDLASVPFFVQWLVRSYGKHTKGALIHDQYWDFVCNNAKLREVNLVFRDAMREDGAPIVRRWLVWSAVSIAGLAKVGLGGFVRLGVWLVALVALLGGIGAAFDADIPWPPVVVLSGLLVVVAALALLVGIVGTGEGDARRKLGFQVTAICVGYAALLAAVTALSRWTLVRDHVWVFVGCAAVIAVLSALPQWPASAIATGTALLVVVPTTAVFLALAVYGLFELLFYAVRYPGRVAKGEPKPAPLVGDEISRPAA